MRTRRPFLCLVLLLVAVAANAQFTPADEQLAESLKNKIIILRGFPHGSHVIYGKDGQLLKGTPGIWTMDGYVKVRKVRLEPVGLKIKGDRLGLLYDDKKGSMQQVDFEQEVTIDLQVGSSTELAYAIKNKFLVPPQHLADVVPAYWRYFVLSMNPDAASQEAAAKLLNESGGFPKPGAKATHPVGVTPPVSTYTPNPEPSNLTRALAHPLKAVFGVIINPDGTTTMSTILKPVGLGVDEQAIAKLVQWRSKPAMKDGKPIAYRATIVVDWHIN